jgi:hypothetical protein
MAKKPSTLASPPPLFPDPDVEHFKVDYYKTLFADTATEWVTTFGNKPTSHCFHL